MTPRLKALLDQLEPGRHLWPNSPPELSIAILTDSEHLGVIAVPQDVLKILAPLGAEIDIDIM